MAKTRRGTDYSNGEPSTRKLTKSVLPLVVKSRKIARKRKLSETTSSSDESYRKNSNRKSPSRSSKTIIKKAAEERDEEYVDESAEGSEEDEVSKNTKNPRLSKFAKEKSKRATIPLKQTKNTKNGSKNTTKIDQSSSKNQSSQSNSGKLGKSESKKSKSYETLKASNKKAKKATKIEPESDTDDDDDDVEWEEVENFPATSDQISAKAPLEITIQSKDNKSEELKKALNRELNRILREKRETLHQICLLSHLAHLTHLTKICNLNLLKSVAFSLLPKGFADLNTNKNNQLNKEKLCKFVKWLKSAFVMSKNFYNEDDYLNWTKCLINRFEKKLVYNYKEFALIFVIFMRALNFSARFINCLTEKSFEHCIVKNLIFKNNKGVVKFCVSKSKKNETKSTEKSKNCKSVENKKPSGKDSTHTTCDCWAEVYCDSMEKWLCINLIDCTVDEPRTIENSAPSPLIYVLSVDNGGAIKDLTKKYNSNFSSISTRRLRLKDDWFNETLESKRFKTKFLLRDRLEDMQIEKDLADLPMPKTVADFKKHPLYVLRRDLLKFQTVYPPDTKPVAHFRNDEPVYPRSAVHTLHTRETWMKEARVVRQGEQPFKLVKGRQKPNKPKSEQIERMVPVYGRWQTEEYVPEPAVDGIVPKNEYGNVELFKESMLPPGTVHLRHPGILSVAKKLNIDCAQAMVGWDFHGCSSHPVFDGIVVCQEYEDTLISVWDQEQAIIAEKEIEKKTKKALKNWARLTRGLLLREKVRRKFGNYSKNPHHAPMDNNDESHDSSNNNNGSSSSKISGAKKNGTKKRSRDHDDNEDECDETVGNDTCYDHVSKYWLQDDEDRFTFKK